MHTEQMNLADINFIYVSFKIHRTKEYIVWDTKKCSTPKKSKRLVVWHSEEMLWWEDAGQGVPEVQWGHVGKRA